MGYIQAFLLIAICSVTGAALGISLMMFLPWPLAMLVILGLILVGLLVLTNRNASCKDLSDIGSGSGPKIK